MIPENPTGPSNIPGVKRGTVAGVLYGVATPPRGRSWSRRLRPLVALAGVAVSLLLQGERVQAAATLSVTPNPVIIRPGETTGTATVRWNTDLPGGAIVTMV